jgi:hypothetical protein
MVEEDKFHVGKPPVFDGNNLLEEKNGGSLQGFGKRIMKNCDGRICYFGS